MPSFPPTPAGPPRFIGGVFGFVFAGIGLTVLGLFWSETSFAGPPLFFRVFGSFIALAFVAMGGMFFHNAFKGRTVQSGTMTHPTATPGTGYICPACGARLGADAEVSPKGDVKCGYCHKWFNIHG